MKGNITMGEKDEKVALDGDKLVGLIKELVDSAKVVVKRGRRRTTIKIDNAVCDFLEFVAKHGRSE
jgi:hypothetical protein